MTPAPVLVFSHLRWDFVFQRPQHVMTRLGRSRPVLFVEEPIFREGEPGLEIVAVAPGVRVAKPYLPIGGTAFGSQQQTALELLLRAQLERDGWRDFAAWLYTPMAVRIAKALHPRTILYDCMDELTGFKDAPAELIEREKELLAAAEAVLTGGPSLYRAKKDRHSFVRCFPSSVDVDHFGRARAGEGGMPSDQPAAKPVLGYCGVIDERMDTEILERLAATHPEWQIVLLGPVVKIDPARLPQAANLHYLGRKEYAELPAYLSGWDVALMPFAIGPATKFISPTKVLEYMAAGRPIVSTPITDVVEPYSEIVYIADGPDAFVRACEQALAAGDDERAQRRALAGDVLRRTSWEETAKQMDEIVHCLADAIPTQHGLTDGMPAEPARSTHASAVILGAGPTGLSAAYHLGEKALLLEREHQVGGCCRSTQADGFTFDLAGHIMFSNDPYVHELYKMLLGDNVHWQEREAWIYSKGVHTRYPFQGSLYGLPPETIQECVMGAIEARYGDWRRPLEALRTEASAVHANGNGNAYGNGNGKAHAHGNANGHGNGLAYSATNLTALDPKVCARDTDCCADGRMETEVPWVEATTHEDDPRNFEEFIYRIWGAGIAKHFAIPYNRKLWTVPLSEMETSWLNGRVPLPDLAEMIHGALTPAPKPMGPNARFGYPLQGGFQALMNGFLPHLEGEVRLGADVTAVSPSRRTVRLRDGSTVEYDTLISTIPLPELIKSMGMEAPAEIREAARGLRRVSVRCVNLGIGRANLSEKHWIYYPEDTVFHRIFLQGNTSPECNPPDGFGLTCEITYSPAKPLPCEGDELIQRCLEDCRRVGIVAADDPLLTAHQVDLPYAYVVYDHERPERVRAIREWLAEHDIVLAGRYSEWEYYNSDHAFLAGKKAAETVDRLLAERSNLRRLGAVRAPERETEGVTAA